MLFRGPLTVSGACALSAAVIAGLNVAGFTITAITKTHKVTDLLGTGAFVVSTVAVASRCLRSRGSLPPVAGLLTGCVALWGTRLALYLFGRILATGHDTRLAAFLPAPGEGWLDRSGANFPIKLAGFWTIQSLWAFVVLLPVTVALAAPVSALSRITPTHLLAAVGFAVGFACEALADYQKYSFKADPRNKGLWIESGVWHYSRHPNYFGEIAVWWAMYLMALPAFTKPLHYGTIVSPLFITWLLLCVSGVPLLEKEYDTRYATNEAYQRYKARTNLLFPWFPRSDFQCM